MGGVGYRINRFSIYSIGLRLVYMVLKWHMNHLSFKRHKPDRPIWGPVLALAGRIFVSDCSLACFYSIFVKSLFIVSIVNEVVLIYYIVFESQTVL